MTRFAILFFLATSLTACNGQNKQTTTIAKEIAPEKFQDMAKDTANVQILDVRTPQEWQTGIIHNAMEINFYDPNFQKEVAQKLSKDKTVLVYCAVGGRSHQAMEQMHSMGFKAVYSMQGGINAWKGAGFPVVQKQ